MTEFLLGCLIGAATLHVLGQIWQHHKRHKRDYLTHKLNRFERDAIKRMRADKRRIGL